MKWAPTLWTLDQIADHVVNTRVSACIDGKYVPARPYGLFSLRNRWRLAWLVFTGRADALVWPGQGDKP